MNPPQFLSHFDRISEAPDAIPRLRRFILDLAVRGKLVEQDPKDEPQTELLKRFNRGSTEDSSDLPRRWIQTKVGELLDFRYGKALPANERLDQGRVQVFGSNGVVGYCAGSLTEEPAIVIGRKGSAGALNLCVGPSWTTDVAYFVTPPPFLNIRFLFIALQTLDLGNLGKGVKPGLNRSDAYQLEMVVPPLAEQHRIVAKVDELMAVCDRLEAGQAEREKRRDRLVAASLNRLNNGDDVQSIRDHAHFHIHHLLRLTTRSVHIQQLRQTILSLAVRGKLVPQDPNDEPAFELLKRIQMERKQLEREKVCKESTILPPVANHERLFLLPPQWEWARLGSLVFALGDGLHGTPAYAIGTPYYFINGNNLVNGKIVIKPTTKTVAFDEFQKHKKPLSLNTVLVSINGTLGNVAFYENELVVLGKSACYFNLPECIDKRFMKLLIDSPHFIGYALENATGTTIKNLSLKAMREFPVSLPPLAEQHRIVAKIDELMALCDRLEAQLVTTQTESRRFLEASLTAILDQASRRGL